MILSDDAKNAMLQGLADTLNDGANSALSIYIEETLAAEIALTNPVELDITAGVMTFKTPPETIAIASGMPTSAKLLNSSGAVIATYTAEEVQLNKERIYQGGYVGILSLKIRI